MNELAIFLHNSIQACQKHSEQPFTPESEERSGAVHDAFLWAGIQITTVVTPARALLSGSPL